MKYLLFLQKIQMPFSENNYKTMNRNHIIVSCALICALMSSSCQTNLDGSHIVVKNAFYDNDTLDSYGFPTLRINHLYFEKDKYGNESVEITYSNHYIEKSSVLDNSTSSGTTIYKLGNGTSIFFYKKEGRIAFLPKSYDSQHYEIVSISKLSQREVAQAPTFNDIIAYKRYGEVKGCVKSITNRKYSQREMFGQDTLIYQGYYTTQYDTSGNLIYEYVANYNSQTGNHKLLFSHSLTYDKNNRLVSERRENRKGTFIVKYEQSVDKQSETISYYADYVKDKPYVIRKNKYTVDSQLKETELLEYWISDDTYHLDQKVIYKGENYANHVYGSVYDYSGTEKRRVKYDEDLSPLEGIIEFGEYSEYYDPYNTYKEDYSSQAIRRLSIENNSHNTTISLEYPWREPSNPVIGHFVTDDKITYDENCNPIKRVFSTYDKSEPNPISTDEYIYLYKFDQYGNWVERHSVLTAHKRKGEEEKVIWKGTIEYREIEYFDQPSNIDDMLFKNLKDYDSHIATLKNEHWTIRIDLMKNGAYRYASWKKKPISSEPNIILYTETDATIKSLGPDRQLVFHNNKYSYEVTWADYNPNYDTESHQWEVIVKQSEDTILTLNNE